MEANAIKKLSAVQIGIIITTLITAGVHFTLLFPDVTFILNALGYLTLLVAFLLPALAKYRNLIRWAFILFTAVTIAAWLMIGERSTLAYLTKLDEAALIVLLFYDQFDK